MRSKYGAVKTTVDGIRFDSKREAKRYGELLLLARAGEIRNLTLQPHFALLVPITTNSLKNINAGQLQGHRVVAEYRADFDYERLDKKNSHGGPKWNYVVEDAKGVRTDVYKLKKRMFEAQYGIQITEV